ncbi:MAG: hypothetical protein E7Z85_04870 [Methanosphaera stadtmanae]|nr:hypothetical protein [Methanosphaera stadtmanae]
MYSPSILICSRYCQLCSVLSCSSLEILFQQGHPLYFIPLFCWSMLYNSSFNDCAMYMLLPVDVKYNHMKHPKIFCTGTTTIKINI